MRSFKKHINKGTWALPESTILAEDPEEEISMMMNQLSFICYAADEMANIMEDTDGMDPEEWWQNKLAVAHSEIQTLYAYMQGRNQQNESVELDEATKQKLFMFKTEAEAKEHAKKNGGKVVKYSPTNYAVLDKDLTKKPGKKPDGMVKESELDEKYDTPVKKKPVSMMSKAEKDKNDERRKAYKDHQKSLRKEDTQIDESIDAKNIDAALVTQRKRLKFDTIMAKQATQHKKEKMARDDAAANRGRTEDTQIDEISMTKMAAYAPKAVKSRNDAKAATHSADSNRVAKAGETIRKRKAGADNYNKKMWGYGNVAPTKESVELDEVSQETLKSYHAKSALDLRNKRDKLEKGTLTTKDHKQGQNRVTGLNRAANKMDESEINDLAAQYINENNITLEELENMTEAELNELIGAAIGGAFKLGAKAVVGATRLAKRAVVNKQGNIRGTAAAKADKAGDKAEKMAKQREAEYKRAKRISDMRKRASDLDKKISDLNSNKTNK